MQYNMNASPFCFFIHCIMLRHDKLIYWKLHYRRASMLQKKMKKKWIRRSIITLAPGLVQENSIVATHSIVASFHMPYPPPPTPTHPTTLLAVVEKFVACRFQCYARRMCWKRGASGVCGIDAQLLSVRRYVNLMGDRIYEMEGALLCFVRKIQSNMW